MWYKCYGIQNHSTSTVINKTGTTTLEAKATLES